MADQPTSNKRQAASEAGADDDDDGRKQKSRAKIPKPGTEETQAKDELVRSLLCEMDSVDGEAAWKKWGPVLVQETKKLPGADEQTLKVVLNLRLSNLKKDETIKQHEDTINQLGSVSRLLNESSVSHLLNESSAASSGCFVLHARATGSSHVNTGHVEAEHEKQQFTLHEIPRGSNEGWPDLEQQWKKRTSVLLGYAGNESEGLTVSNEASIQTYVQAAVQDAVFICNRMLAAANPDKKVMKLGWRREASLLSTNKPDHTVVFDLISEIDILSIEDKKPYKNIEQKKKVNGQLYDFLGKMLAFGHPNPFGLLTTFENTWVAWIDEKHNEIAVQADRLSPENIVNIAASLPAEMPQGGAKAGAGGTVAAAILHSPAPAESVISPDWVGCEDGDAKTKSTTVEFECLTRKVYQSNDSYKANQLVPLLCNAIFCGLKNFNGERKILSVKENEGKKISFNALMFFQTKYDWVKATVPKVQGTAPKKGSNVKQDRYFAFEVVGVGETSRAFRAFDQNGYDCVIKMYIRKFDGATELKEKQFQDNADKSVKRELKNYKLIYGDEWEKRVWTRKLHRFHCLILPFFKPIRQEERSDQGVLDEIRALLEGKFKDKKLAFAESDQLWRHVGRDSRDGSIVLFDLADLVDKKDESDEEFQRYCDRHIACLKGKAPKQEEQKHDNEEEENEKEQEEKNEN